jgi:hypothetical protein
MQNTASPTPTARAPLYLFLGIATDFDIGVDVVCSTFVAIRFSKHRDDCPEVLLIYNATTHRAPGARLTSATINNSKALLLLPPPPPRMRRYRVVGPCATVCSRRPTRAVCSRARLQTLGAWRHLVWNMSEMREVGERTAVHSSDGVITR